MSGPIGLIDTTADGAGSGGIAGVYEDDGDACQPRLVFDKEAELGERPGVQDASLWLAQPYPRANTLQVLKGNPSVRAFSLRNQTLADTVVHMLCETKLFPPPLLQEPFGRLRSFGLELSPEPGVSVTKALDHAPGEGFPFGVHGDVRNAEVYAEEVFHVGGGRVHRVADGEKVEGSIAENQIAFSLAGGKELALSIPAHEGDALPVTISPYRDFGLVHIPPEDTVIVGDGTEGPKRALGFLDQLVGVRNFGNAPDHDLSRQPGESLGFVVDRPVDGVLPECLILPRPCGNAVTGTVRPLKGFLEGLRLFRRRAELHLSRKFHAWNILHFRFRVKT